jgi:hypothetical protein
MPSTRRQSPWSAGDRCAWYSLDVGHFALNAGGPSEDREFGEEAVDRRATADGLHAGSQ